MAGQELDEERRRNIERTYFGLRLGMVALAALLFASIIYEWIASSYCLQSSISAYYYTPTQPVLIAALCAIGAGLIIYQGSTPAENALFNVAGPLAFVVAFVPTGFREQDARCGALEVLTKDAAIPNNITALVVAGVVAAGIGGLNLTRFREASVGAADAEEKVAALMSAAVTTALFVVLAIIFVVDGPFFLRYAHGGAAIGFFAVVLIVMWLNAKKSKDYGRRYTVVLATTVVGGILLGAIRLLDDGFETFIFWLEAVGIAGFMAFWLVQTREMTGIVARDPDSSSSASEPSRSASMS
jgi:hypothetical protein